MKGKLLPYSTLQLILAVFLFYYSEQFCGHLQLYGLLAGLQPAPPSQIPWQLGNFIRHFSGAFLIPSLLLVVLVSRVKRLQVFSFPPKSNRYFHWLLMGCISLLMLVSAVSIAFHGPFSCLKFFDYSLANVSLLTYCPLVLYFLYVFRDESFLETVIVVVLGGLAVSTCWELPLNLAFHGETHIFMYATGTFRYVLMPLLFWFYLFRRHYYQLLRNRWYLAAPLMLTITVLTATKISFVMAGYIPLLINISLHVNYAILLVFLPFQHYYTKERR